MGPFSLFRWLIPAATTNALYLSASEKSTNFIDQELRFREMFLTPQGDQNSQPDQDPPQDEHDCDK